MFISASVGMFYDIMLSIYCHSTHIPIGIIDVAV